MREIAEETLQLDSGQFVVEYNTTAENAEVTRLYGSLGFRRSDRAPGPAILYVTKSARIHPTTKFVAREGRA